MTHPQPPARSNLPCCATVIPTRGTTLAARLERRFYQCLDAMVAWRCRLHESWHRHDRRKFPF